MDNGAVQKQPGLLSVAYSDAREQPPSPHPSSPSIGILVLATANDGLEFLCRSLDAIRNQSFDHWKLVLVNDGGDPRPVEEIVQKTFPGDPRVIVIHHSERRGKAIAVNSAAAFLDTAYATILWGECFWPPQFLAMVIDRVTCHRASLPHVKAIICQSGAVDGDDAVPLSLPGFVFDLQAARELGLFDVTWPDVDDQQFRERFEAVHDLWLREGRLCSASMDAVHIAGVSEPLARPE